MFVYNYLIKRTYILFENTGGNYNENSKCKKIYKNNEHISYIDIDNNIIL